MGLGRLNKVFEDEDPGVALILAGDDGPWGDFGVGLGDHILHGFEVFSEFFMVAPVFVRQFMGLVRVFRPVFKAVFLFVLVNDEEVF